MEAGVRIENKLEYDQEYNRLRETQREKDEPCEENMTNECMSGMRLIDLSLLNKFLDKKACCRIFSQRIDVQTGFDFAAFLDNTTDSEKHVSGTSFTKRFNMFLCQRQEGWGTNDMYVPSFMLKREVRHVFSSTLHVQCAGVPHSCTLTG